MNPATSIELTPARRRRLAIIGLGVAMVAVMGIGLAMAMAGPKKTPVYGHKVVKSYPHDQYAFCQGLVVEGDTLYEGTGREGQSTLRVVDLKTGQVQKSIKLPDVVFGEGITVFEGQIYQLTWKNNIAYVYDKDTFQYKTKIRYSGEGWGLTHDGTHLIMSDGSSSLRFVNPKTFKTVKKLRVRENGRNVEDLNELEYVDGKIYANVWYKDLIAQISPKTGDVEAWIDLRGIISDQDRGNREHVLNGIAYDPQSKRLFVTGKNWPYLYEIQIIK